MKNKFAEFIHKNYVVIVIFLLCAFSAQVLYAIFTYSPTYDEKIHLIAGYGYVKNGVYEKLGHPPLRTLNSVPLLFFDIAQASPGEYDFGDSFLFYLRMARLVTLLYGILLGMFVFLFAKELFGMPAGLFALFLYSFEPNIIAHSSLVTTDVSVTCFVLISVYLLYKFVQTGTAKKAAVAGVSFGIAFMAKFSAILLLPISAFLVVIHAKGKRKLKYFSMFVLILIVSVFVINAAYLFRETFEKHDFKSGKLKMFGSALQNVRWPLPQKYLLGLEENLIHTESHGLPAYLLGEFSDVGWWHYFFIAFFIKTPIPLLLLIFISFFLIIKDRHRNSTFLFIPVLFFFIVVSFFNNVNIGLRHFLPAYPFLIIAASYSIDFLKNRRNFLYVLSVWYVLSAVLTAPNQLAYFNEFIGGPINGYKFLIDSNLDWGQNELLLKRYIENNNVTITVNPGCEYVSGKIVIAANNLVDFWNPDARDCHAWLRNLAPTGHIGGGYLIFEVP